jgi:hypothetical protein
MPILTLSVCAALTPQCLTTSGPERNHFASEALSACVLSSPVRDVGRRVYP